MIILGQHPFITLLGRAQNLVDHEHEKLISVVRAHDRVARDCALYQDSLQRISYMSTDTWACEEASRTLRANNRG